MSQRLRTSCVCGWEAIGSEDEVVDATLDHGLRVHNMAGTREQVLERAERIDEPGPAADPEPGSAALSVVDIPEMRRFEARLDGRTIGYTRYHLTPESIALLHTEIDPDQEGKGFGSRLAARVLEDARASGLKVLVRCPFITAYVRRHRADYPDIEVVPEQAGSSVS